MFALWSKSVFWCCDWTIWLLDCIFLSNLWALWTINVFQLSFRPSVHPSRSSCSVCLNTLGQSPGWPPEGVTSISVSDKARVCVRERPHAFALLFTVKNSCESTWWILWCKHSRGGFYVQKRLQKERVCNHRTNAVVALSQRNLRLKMSQCLARKRQQSTGSPQVPALMDLCCRGGQQRSPWSELSPGFTVERENKRWVCW